MIYFNGHFTRIIISEFIFFQLTRVLLYYGNRSSPKTRTVVKHPYKRLTVIQLQWDYCRW